MKNLLHRVLPVLLAACVAGAVGAVVPDICKTVDLAVDAIRRDGRLIYVGAGTSGRIAALDAAECPPTFSSPPAWVQAVIAGGSKAVIQALEGAEDEYLLLRDVYFQRRNCQLRDCTQETPDYELPEDIGVEE